MPDISRKGRRLGVGSGRPSAGLGSGCERLEARDDDCSLYDAARHDAIVRGQVVEDDSRRETPVGDEKREAKKKRASGYAYTANFRPIYEKKWVSRPDPAQIRNLDFSENVSRANRGSLGSGATYTCPEIFEIKGFVEIVEPPVWYTYWDQQLEMFLGRSWIDSLSAAFVSFSVSWFEPLCSILEMFLAVDPDYYTYVFCSRMDEIITRMYKWFDANILEHATSGVTYYNEELKMLLRLLKALPDTIPEGDLHDFRHYVLDPIKMKDIG
ncbi:hypothetical protein B0H14DRAFT_3612575 [Mycena olivaceomarginata]|nr:hypothetical protein B0H14DRAFT_3612575 [Mycena olivaceomarginata]